MTDNSTSTNKVGMSGDVAAEYLGVDKRTLERWRCLGTGPKFVKVGRKCLYRLTELELWIEGRVFASTAEQKHARKQVA